MKKIILSLSKRHGFLKRICTGLLLGVALLLIRPASIAFAFEYVIENVSSPNLGDSFNTLNGVTSLSPNDAWAVGYWSNRSGPQSLNQTLIEHWDGASWNIVSGPNDTAAHNVLNAITSISPNDVWAVGFVNPVPQGQILQRTLVQHWDGARWQTVTSPNLPREGSYGYSALLAISAVSADDVWAAGYGSTNFVDSSSPTQTLIEHWDGASWSLVPSPSVSGYINQLLGIEAISENDVWAVGFVGAQGGYQQTLIEHWDGASWQTVPSPNLGSAQNVLSDVTSISANDVWAYGFYRNSLESTTHGLALHWDGISWTAVTDPSIDALNDYGYGGITNVPQTNQLFIAAPETVINWDGTDWKTIQNNLGFLRAVSSDSPSNTWAVGGTFSTYIVRIRINNLPVAGAIAASVNPLLVNTTMTTTADFIDSDASDIHTAIWDWGDGTTSDGMVVESNGSGSVSGNHAYFAAGVYVITLTVTDNYGGTGTQTFQYLTVYDPTPQGLFSAGQKYLSPTGAYLQDTNLAGPVMFGLSYKYQGEIPVGNRHFSMDFDAADFHFNATSIEYLVITGGIGSLRGTGTVNGSGAYDFLVTGNESTNTIRIQIKDVQGNSLYDTQPGASDIANPITTLVAGNVLAH